MLKPLIVRGPLGRVWPSRRIERHELDHLLSYNDIRSPRHRALLESEQAVPGQVPQRLFRSNLKPEPVAVESGCPRQVGDRDADPDKLRYRHRALLST